MLRNWLAHPLTRGLDLDDPRTSELRRKIIQAKPFLRQIYAAWYRIIQGWVDPSSRRLLEIGSGASLSTEFFPELISTDVFWLPWLSLVLDGLQLPFASGTLDAILMVNTFHHIPDPSRFLEEANRCLRPGGNLCLVEPWVTPWSRLIYTRLHHEPFDPDAEAWLLPDSGPLSSANGALPWMVFERDWPSFVPSHPQWALQDVKPIMPFLYLLSGGVSLRSLMPGWAFPFWAGLERLLNPLTRQLAMFAAVRLVKTTSQPSIVDQPGFLPTA